MDGETLARVGYLAIILVALGGWALVEFRQRMGQALRMGMAWGLIFVGIAAGYGLWTDIRQDAMPIQTLARDGAIEVDRAADGHYYLTLTINGTSVPFMVDTGASVIALTERDADRLGIRPSRNAFTAAVQTANGVVRAAPVTLNSVDIGGLVVRDVRALVVSGRGLNENLLGLSYLTRLKRFEYSNNKLVLEN